MPITATLVTMNQPRAVQIVVSGLTAGASYVVQGSTADGTLWPVPGGVGISSGANVNLVDNRAALNVPVIYRVTSGAVTEVATAVVVPYVSAYGLSRIQLLQSLDGRTVVEVEASPEDSDARNLDLKGSVVDVPGRTRPLGRYVRGGDGGGSISGFTVGSDTTKLHSLLVRGRPLVVRTTSFLPGIPAVDLIKPMYASHVLRGIKSVDYDKRFWSIPFILVDDPEPGAVISVWTWDDFDLALANYIGKWDYGFETSEGGAVGWAAASTGTAPTLTQRLSSDSFSGGAHARATATAAAAEIRIAQTTNLKAAAAGQTWTVSEMVRGAAGRTVQARINWSTGATAVGSAVTMDGTWKLVTVTGVAPASTTTIAPGAIMAATGVTVGSTLDLDAVLTRTTAARPTGTFDDLFANSTGDQFDVFSWGQLL